MKTHGYVFLFLTAFACGLGVPFCACGTVRSGDKCPSLESARPFTRSSSDAAPLTIADRQCGVVHLWAAVKHRFALMQYAEPDWDAILPTYLEAATNAQSDSDYYLLLERMLAQLKDNHTQLQRIPGREKLARPRIKLERVRGSYVITSLFGKSDALETSLRIGDIVTAVDGAPVEELVEQVTPYICASTENERVDVALARILWRPRGTDVRITVEKRGAAEDHVMAANLSYLSNWPAHDNRTLTSEMLDGRIGHIAIRTFGNAEVVDQFNQALDKLRSMRGLILDLRDNAGGNDTYAAQIAGRLLEEEIRFYRLSLEDEINLKSLDAILEYMRQHDISKAEDLTVVAKPSGPWQYSGPLAILVNVRTGSAAEDIVIGLQDASRVCVVGEQTAGGTGNPFYVELPGGCRGRICANMILRLDGSRFHGVGVCPDIVVTRTIEGIRAGKDEILEAALAHLDSLLRGTSQRIDPATDHD